MAKKTHATKSNHNQQKNASLGKNGFTLKPIFFISALIVIIIFAVVFFFFILKNNKSEKTDFATTPHANQINTNQPQPVTTAQSPVKTPPNQSQQGTPQSNNQPGFKPIDLSKIDPSQSPANDPNNPKVKRRESVKLVKDSKGQITERTDDNFDKDGNVSMHNRYTYKYDDAGNMTEQRFYSNTPEGVQTANTVNFTKYENKLKTENLFISYDAQGKEISRQKNTFKYNQNGQCIEDISYGANNNPILKVEYIYKNGNLTGERYTHYNPDGSIQKKEAYDYDDRGKLIEK